MSTTLLSAPLEITGNWRESPVAGALAVLEQTRKACLVGMKMRSDRQPARVRVEHRAIDFPGIWLHDDDPDLAWVLVTIGPQDWCQLAYEFGHELGHIVCNSWDHQAVPRRPCQWLEESLAEAFALRGLGRLQSNLSHNPTTPIPLSLYDEIAEYHLFHLRKNQGAIEDSDVALWLSKSRAELELQGQNADAQPAVTLRILELFQEFDDLVDDMGGLNRWPERSAAPLEEYLQYWRRSCLEIGASGKLPDALVSLFKL